MQRFYYIPKLYGVYHVKKISILGTAINITVSMHADSPPDANAHPMSERSNADLYKILSFKDQFSDEVYTAALEELKQREKATQGFEHARTAWLNSEEALATATPKVSIDLPPNLFTFNSKYLATPLILYVNVLIFIIMTIAGVGVFEPSTQDLADWGGNLSGLTLTGDLWRLFTSMFLHAGLFHLIANVYPLLLVGSILEMNIGKVRYVVSYIACGIIASVSSVVYHDNAVAVGASGAVFGLFGLLISLLVTKSLDIPAASRNNLLAGISVFTVYNLVAGFTQEGIDNAAHVGGLISGFIIGFIYSPSLRHAESSRLATGTIAGVAVAIALLLPHFFSTKYSEYYAALADFSANEKIALEIYAIDRPEAGSYEAARYTQRIKTEGIDVWEKNLTHLRSLRDMPTALQTQIDLLIKYCALRIQHCELLQQAIADEGLETLNKMQKIDHEIDGVIKALHNSDEE
jgi:rhomboid protease GluP